MVRRADPRPTQRGHDGPHGRVRLVGRGKYPPYERHHPGDPVLLPSQIGLLLGLVQLDALRMLDQQPGGFAGSARSLTAKPGRGGCHLLRRAVPPRVIALGRSHARPGCNGCEVLRPPVELAAVIP